MDYSKHYKALMERTKHRNLVGYVERHHIIPRCMGGSDDIENIAVLTPEEHFVAHQLLVKMYPQNPKLISAVMFMSGNRYCNNRMYGWLKKRFNEREFSEETRRKIGLSKIGKQYSLGLIRSEETCQKISESKKGKPIRGKGRKLTDDQKQSMRKPKTEEHKAALKAAALKPETREKLKQINLGKVVSDEQKRKQSEVMKGRPSPRRGVPMSEESKRKLSESQKTRLAKRRASSQ